MKEPNAEPKKIERPNPDERFAEMSALFNFYEAFRAQYDLNAETYWHLYTGYVEPLDEDDDRSNLHIMLPYESVDTWRARLLTTFFGNQRPYVTCLPRPTGGMTPELIVENIAKGKLAGALLDTQFDKNEIVSLMYNYFTGLLAFPIMTFGVGWKYEEKMVKRRKMVRYPGDMNGYVDRVVMEIEERNEVVYDDNEITLIDYDDFWPDPYGQNVDKARGSFVREYVTRQELEQLMDNLNDIVKLFREGRVYDPDYELEQNVLNFGDTGFSMTTFYGEEINQESGYEFGSKYSLFELLHYWTDDEHIVIFQRQQVIFDGPNHYWRHGKKPVNYTSFEPLPGKPIGMSAIQLIEHLSAEIDTQRNQRIDFAAMVLNPMFEVAGDLDESELIWRRAGIIHVQQVGTQVKSMPLGEVPQSAFVETNNTKQEAYSTLAVPDVVRGVDAPVKQTATYTAAQNTNASVRFDVKLKLWESLGLKRMAMLMDCNNQQFIDSARLVRQDWKSETVDAWQFVNPWEILGEWDYRPAGTAVDPAANKELKLQRLDNFITKNAQDPYLKHGALRRKYIELSDLSNDPNEFVKTDDEIEEEQAAQAQAQSQQIQAEQQLQSDQNTQKLIADIVKQVVSALLKGGEPSPDEGRVGNGQTQKRPKAKTAKAR